MTTIYIKRERERERERDNTQEEKIAYVNGKSSFFFLSRSFCFLFVLVFFYDTRPITAINGIFSFNVAFSALLFYTT